MMKALRSDVTSFFTGTRKTPIFISEQEIAADRTTTASSKTAQKLEFSYFLRKMVPNNRNIRPGWIGFNSIPCQDDMLTFQELSVTFL